MYNAFYKFERAPFENTPDPDFFFPSTGHREALAALVYGIREGKGLILISGDVGTGKTLLMEKLKKHLDEDFLVVDFDSPKIRINDIVKGLGKVLRVKRAKSDSYADYIAKIREALLAMEKQGKKLVLLIDEAQELSAKTLDGIRLLSNLSTSTSKLIQIILLGQPELLRKLRGEKLRALSQRIIIHRLLNRLSPAESEAYIRHRLKTAGGDTALFTPKGIRLVHQATKGIPRLINQICDNALLAGYAESLSTIDTPTIQEAIRDASHMPTLAPQRDAMPLSPADSPSASSTAAKPRPDTSVDEAAAAQPATTRWSPWLLLAGAVFITLLIISLGQRLLDPPSGIERVEARSTDVPRQQAPQPATTRDPASSSPAGKSAEPGMTTQAAPPPARPPMTAPAKSTPPYDPTNQVSMDPGLPMAPKPSTDGDSIPPYDPMRQTAPDSPESSGHELPELPTLPDIAVPPAQPQAPLLIDQTSDARSQTPAVAGTAPPLPFHASNDPRDEIVAIPPKAIISRMTSKRYGFWNKTMEEILLSANPGVQNLSEVPAGALFRFPYISNQRLIVRQGDQFYIYLKSISTPLVSQRFEQELKDKGERVVTFPDDALTPSAYRTYLGPYASWAEAEQKADTIRFQSDPVVL